MNADTLAVRVGRDGHLVEQILFIDGLNGSGKTMMTPILSTLARVEVQRFEHIYEYTCGLNHLGRLSDDGALVLLRMYADLAAYNVMIGRESNFRWKDQSGVLSNPGGWRYLRRLFRDEGDAVVQRIRRDRPILQIMSHQLLGVAAPLFQAFGSRLTLVEMVRHPLHLLRHWHSYISRYGTDLRDFTIWINADGRQVPWFARGWEERYVSSNKMDRVILSIERLTDLAEGALAGLQDDEKNRVLVIPFESFVTDPNPFLNRLTALLGSHSTGRTARELRRQRVPRRITTDGLDLEIYRRYSWQSPDKSTSEAAELRRQWEFAASEATSDGLQRLERLCDRYERHYLSG